MIHQHPAKRSDTFVIHLEWYECELVIHVGGHRQTESLKRNLNHWPTTAQSIKALYNHIESAGAEKAVAKLLNIDWPASINCFNQGVADVGRNTEVRYRTKDEYDLLVRPRDPDERIYVLVRGALPDYEIIGWMRGQEAKQDRFLSNPGGNGECFLIPETELHAMSDFPMKEA